MQLCIFYLLTVRRQENKVFSAAFAAENTSFPAGGSKLLLTITIDNSMYVLVLVTSKKHT
jgi:hypothetical protein